MKLRKPLIAASMITALGVTALAGCSSDGGSKPSTPAGDGSLTIAKPDGPITVENNNPWVGDSSAQRLGYANALFEPLAITNSVDPTAEPVPWLASEFEWSEDYTSVVITARDGVTWSDGESFTADDIAFTFQLIKDNPAFDTSALKITDISVDGSTVTLGFEQSLFVKQNKVLLTRIVPEHVWKDAGDPTTFTNEDAVGTGPYTLSKFTSQSVELASRDDYWGGEVAVPTLYFVSYADNTALTTALVGGDADWAQIFIPNVQSAYIDKDPEHNIYWAPAGLGIDTLFVNTQTKPFDDVAFRQAINKVIDRDAHAEIAREGGVPVITSVTGLPTPVGDSFISDEYQGEDYEVDVDGAKEILEDAGYTWDGDTLIDPDGEAVTFELAVPQGWADYVTGISLISDSVKALGVEATVNTPDADNWTEDLSTGDFQAAIHWTDSAETPYDFYSDQMDGRFLQPIGEAANYNYGRFDSEEATQALETYATTTDEAERQEALDTIEKIYVEEVPAMPVGTRPIISQYNTRDYVGWPSDEDPYVDADPTQPTMVYILTKLQPAE
jgi:peptide/nickel transport system substrate-binding protein